jgi:hypothetical protein
MTARTGIDTVKFELHSDLHQRVLAVQAAMQKRTGRRPKITLNDVVQELLDEYEKTSALIRDLGVKP